MLRKGYRKVWVEQLGGLGVETGAGGVITAGVTSMMFYD